MAYSATEVNYISDYISVESPSPYPLLDNDTSAERRPGRLKLPVRVGMQSGAVGSAGAGEARSSATRKGGHARVLIEILAFFAIAAGLATVACLLPRAPAAPWPLAVPAGLAILAGSGFLTAVITGDPAAGRVLGVAGLAAWVAGRFLLRHWQGLATLMFAMLTLAALSYVAYACGLTAAQTTGPVFALASSLLLLLEVAALTLSLSYAFEMLDVLGRRGAPPPPPGTGPPPLVAIQVPTYNEPVEVVQRTLEALARLDYPAYMVQVVDNNTPDPRVWGALEAVCERLGPRFQFMHLERWPGFKAGALNEATRRLPAEVEVIGVVDADYEVHPGWLMGTAPHFADPHVAFVQAAQHYRDWEDDAYLRGLFFSYRYFFDVTMPSRAHRNAIIFCGTMGLIRRTVLEAAGGWDPTCITEDAECSLRMLALPGEMTGVYDPRPWGAGLMPLSFDGLKKQRFRWALGGIQMLRTHWREVLPFARHRLRLSTAQRVHFLLGSAQWFGDLLTALFTLILVVTAAAAAAHHPLPVRQMAGAVLAVPVVFLVTGVLRALWALRRTTGCTWGDALRALRVWFALSWVVSLACLRGAVKRGAAFLRTPKVTQGGRVLRGIRYSAAESTIAVAVVLAVAAMLVRALSLSTILLAILLLFEAFVYSSAPWAAVSAERITMTPARRAFLLSPQSTGDRPSMAPLLTALGAGGVVAAAVAIVVAAVGAAPSTSPGTRFPNIPPIGGAATPAPAATPSPASTPRDTPSPAASPSPSPSLSASPSASPSPSASASPSPSPSASPSPYPSPSPSPAASPTPRPSLRSTPPSSPPTARP